MLLHHILVVALDLEGVSPTHEPTVATQSCSAGIGHMDVKFHGGASWLYNLFSSLIAGIGMSGLLLTSADELKKSISGQICGIVKKEIDVEVSILEYPSLRLYYYATYLLLVPM
jgi:hypothetical protein